MHCLVVGSVVYHRVVVPAGFVGRFRGMRRHRGAMLFASSSVHGFGMDRPLQVVAIGSGSVLSVRRLRPGSVVRVPGATHLLEIETDLPVPEVGDPVRTYDPCDGGTSRDLCLADREPGGRQ